jgi:hypothetical protein
MKRPLSVVFGAFAVCAVLGFVNFGILSWRATSIERLEPADVWTE